MSIKMKTYYERNDSVNEVLQYNGIDHFNNAFELIFQNVKKRTKQIYEDMNFVLIKATMTPLTIIKTNSSISLSKKEIEKYIVMFENIENEQGEQFSSFVDNLCEKDKILIIDGIILENNTTFETNTKTVSVRSENNPSVFLFKYGSPLIKVTNLLCETNLSNVTGTGIYSLYGLVKKIIKYTDRECMVLRIQCHDKCVIKIYKYPHSVFEIMNIVNVEAEYDFSSNQVDILVKTPDINFMSLVCNQQIYLNNVKVRYSNNLDLFLLYLNGRLQNLKADPIETVSVNSLKSPTELNFPMSDNLIPSNQLNTKHNISIDNQFSNDSNQINSPIKNLSLNIEENVYKSVDLTKMSPDDNINVSPCKDILALQSNVNKCMIMSTNNNTTNGFSKKNIENTNQNDYSNCPSREINNINDSINNQIEKNQNISFSPPFLATQSNELSTRSTSINELDLVNLSNDESTSTMVKKMSIKMKTYCERNNSVNEVLQYNGIDHFNNAFGLIFKNVEKCTKQCYKDMDFVLIKATMTPLTIIKTNSSISLSKKKIQKYIVMFENIENEQGEQFSSFVNNLCEKDKILIIDGIVLKNNTTFEKNTKTVSVRSENNSSVFLFKYGSPLIKKTNLLSEKNISAITGTGIYSLFGLVKKIIKYTDEEFMLLRIKCHDKCVVKIHKYPHSVCEIWNIFNEESNAGVKFDFSSNKVDILIKTPAINFMSLVPNQQIHLKNIKVRNSGVSDIFSLYLKGNAENLKAYSIEIANVSNFVSPSTKFDILKPASTSKRKHDICSDDQLKSVPNKYKISQIKDDSCKDIIYSNLTNDQNTDGLCSTLSNEFLNSTLNTLSLEKQSNCVQLSNVNSKEPKQCIGPCRLIYTVPNVYTSKDGQEFMSAYCAKCCSFFMKSSLIRLNVEYRCPECSTIVSLVFFFKMNFLYGRDFSKSIEVCCFNSYAEHIIKKVSKIKDLTLEKYLLCQETRKLILNTMKSLIDNNTKVNIIVYESLTDNTNILLAIDTKYVVTNPIY